MKSLLGKLKKGGKNTTKVRDESYQQSLRDAYEQNMAVVEESQKKIQEAKKKDNPYSIEDDEEKVDVSKDDDYSDEHSDDDRYGAVNETHTKKKKKVIKVQEDDDDDEDEVGITSGSLKKDDRKKKKKNHKIGVSEETVKTVVDKYDNVIVKPPKQISKKPRVAPITNLKGLSAELKEIIDALNEKEVTEVPDYETIFSDAGVSQGLEIWHVQKLEPVRVDSSDIGKFNTGDCYLVLYTHDSQDLESRPKSLYLWFGKNASALKRCICCNLADYFKSQMDNVTTFVEHQDSESNNFVLHMNNKIKYVDFGTDDNILKKKKTVGKQTKLIRIVTLEKEIEIKFGDKVKKHTERKLVGKRVPLGLDLLKAEDVLILLTPNEMFIWNGSKASAAQKVKAEDLLVGIKHEEKRGNQETHFIHQSKEPQEFLKHLTKLTKEQVEYYEKDSDDTILYAVKFDDEKETVNFSIEETRPLTRKLLDPKAAWVVSTKYETYSYYGYNSLEIERKHADAFAVKLSNLTGAPFYRIWEKFETVLFRECFDTEFYPLETPYTYAVRKNRYLSKVMKEKKKKNVEIFFETFKPNYEESLLDPWQEEIKSKEFEGKDYDIKEPTEEALQVWRVKSAKKGEKLEDNLVGHFWSEDCYLVYYQAFFDPDEEEEEEEEEDEKDDKKKKKEEEDEDDEEEEEEDDDYESDDDSEKKKLAMISQMKGVKYDSADEDESDDYTDDEEEEEEKKFEIDERFVKKKNKNSKIHHLDRKILFCWEGIESDKIISLHMLKNNFIKQVDGYNPTEKIVQKQYREGKDFLRIFKNELVIHQGSHENYSLESYSKKSHLYRIYCLTQLNSRAVEVDCHKSSLNSNDIFILVAPHSTYFWSGAQSTDGKKQVAIKFVKILNPEGNDFTAISEGFEPEEFWEDMEDESGNYESKKLKYSQGNVYECTIMNDGNYRIMNIGLVGQQYLSDDLFQSHYTMIFEFPEVVYIWYPKEVTKREMKNAMLAAESLFDDEEEAEEGEEEEEGEKDQEEKEKPKKKKQIPVPIVEIYQGKEPRQFRHAFPEWSKTVQHVDKFDKRNEKKIQKFKNTVKAAIPFLKIIRKRYRYLLTDDENVNVHNMVTLYNTAKRKRDWDSFKEAVFELSTDRFQFTEDFAAEFYKFVILSKDNKQQQQDDEDEHED